jgi:AcrR family transcriptional regulator
MVYTVECRTSRTKEIGVSELGPSEELELPHAVALAWGVATNPQRGPKRELSIERIVEVAVQLADGGGLAAVSMAAVASELGFSAMSLYRYVAAKDDLLLLMEEEGVGLPPESIREAEGWQAGLRAYLSAVTDTYVAHPWLLDLPITGTPITPNSLAWLDAVLEVLEPTPFTAQDRLAVSLMLLAQARWEGHLSRGQAAAEAAEGAPSPEIDRRRAALLLELVSAERFPFLAPLLQSGAFGDDGYDPFVFAADRLLEGLEGYVRDREAGAPPAAAPPVLADPAERDPKVKEAVKARREAEKRLREARTRERDALKAARDRLAR